MSTSFQIFITGTNRGLGLSITRILLEQGHTLHSYSRKSSDALDALKTQYPDHLFLYFGNVTNESEIEQTAKAVGQNTEGLDILINNAAVRLLPAEEVLADLTFDNFVQTFEINSIAPLKVSKHIVPLLQKGNRKLLVNISSEAGSIADSWRKSDYAYCMSKAAVNMSGKILQNDMRDHGIKVLNIHPGWFSSDMGGKTAPITPDDSAKDVCDTICRPWNLDDPVYIDFNGEPMNW